MSCGVDPKMDRKADFGRLFSGLWDGQNCLILRADLWRFGDT